MKDVLPEVDAWRTAGNQVAIATVVKVEGSAPRPVGATMAVSSAGDLAGSVSGGCVETAVFRGSAGGPAHRPAEADPLRHHRRDGLGRRARLRRHDRSLRRAGHGMTGLAPSRVEIQARLEEALAGRVPVAVATVVRGGQVGAKLLILPDETLGGLGDATLDAAVDRRRARPAGRTNDPKHAPTRSSGAMSRSRSSSRSSRHRRRSSSSAPSTSPSR